MTIRQKRWGFLILSITLSGIAEACPFCNSDSAAEVRTTLFGPDLIFNLSVTILPFIIFSLIGIGIYTGGFKLKLTKKKR